VQRIRTAEAPRASAALVLAAALSLGAVLLLLAVWLAWPGAAGAAVNTAPPAAPVKLVFIHHSTGEAWLSDEHGGLGLALRDNDYFVSDTNYGWGPEAIGDSTDIGHWWTWFRSPGSPTYMTALYAESGQSCGYSRLAADPGGPNQIVVFKSCFPNSDLLGGAAAAPPPIASNPLKGQGAGGEDFTVANAKGVYKDLLPYFAAHQEKLFVCVVAPPIQAPQIPANGRALADWLVDEWLASYAHDNVFVFDFYNVLTSRAGGGASDAGLEGGNHHRVWNGAVQHKTDDGVDYLMYPSGGDDHPNAAGDQKATAELLPLLNNAYNAWKGNAGGDTLGPQTVAPRATSVRKGKTATLYYMVTDDQSAGATVTITIATPGGTVKKTLALGLQPTGQENRARFTCKLARGSYRFTIDARDLAGNAAQTPLGSNTLTVR